MVVDPNPVCPNAEVLVVGTAAAVDVEANAEVVGGGGLLVVVECELWLAPVWNT